MNILAIPGMPNPYDTLPELSKSVLSKVKKALDNIDNREQVFSTLQRMGSQALINARQEDIGNDRLFKSLPRELQYKYAYVPYVIAELAWDYADTIVKLSANLRFCNKAKRLSSKIKELRLDYERLRAPIIDEERRNSEVENMYIFEDETQNITTKLTIDLHVILNGYDECSVLYLISVCQCEILLRALFQYCDHISNKISNIAKQNIENPLPKQMPQLLNTVRLCYEVIADIPTLDNIKSQYIEVYANQIALVGFNELP